MSSVPLRGRGAGADGPILGSDSSDSGDGSDFSHTPPDSYEVESPVYLYTPATQEPPTPATETGPGAGAGATGPRVQPDEGTLLMFGGEDGDAHGAARTYTSFGERSPKRDQAVPSTDFYGGQRSVRTSKRFFYLVVVLVLLAAIGAIVFFFVPREVKIVQSALEAKPLRFYNETGAVVFQFSDLLYVSNPNYATLSVSKIRLDFVFNNPPAAAITVGSYTTTTEHRFQPRTSNGQITVSGIVNQTLDREAFRTLVGVWQLQCASTSRYDLDSSGSARVSFLAVNSNADIALKHNRDVNCQ